MARLSSEDFLSRVLSHLNSVAPNWDEPNRISPPICIPANTDIVKKHVGPRDKDASGFKSEFFEEGWIKGDDAETALFNVMQKCQIGGILISNFERLEFWDNICDKIPEKLRQTLESNCDFSDRSTKKCYECDYLFFHPRLGIYVIEVKAANMDLKKQRHKQYRSARNQIEKIRFALQNIYLSLFERDNLISNIDTFFSGFGAICSPNSELNFPENHQMEHINSSKMTSSELEKFWNAKIQAAPQRNLFKDQEYQSFRNFLLYIIGYRSFAYFSTARSAVHIAKTISTQKVVSQTMNPDCIQNDGTEHFIRLSSKADDDHYFYLTPEQLAVLECKHDRQIIYGPPGSGKTLIFMQKILDLGKINDGKPLVVWTRLSFRKKVEHLIKLNEKILKRKILFTFPTENKDELDVVRDEMGIKGSSFLLWRSKCSGRTICIVTGNISAAEYGKEISSINNILQLNATAAFTVWRLQTVMRGTNKIIDHWRKYFHGYECHIGHGYGISEEPQTEDKYSTTSETLGALSVTLKHLLENDKISPKNIAVVAARNYEVKQIKHYLEKSFSASLQRQELELCGLFQSFGFANAQDDDDDPNASINSETPLNDSDYQEGAVAEVLRASELTTSTTAENSFTDQRETVLIVDEFANVLSFEWPIVIVCSLRCAELYETFKLVACSRAIGLLIVLERDHARIQEEMYRIAVCVGRPPREFGREEISKLFEDALFNLSGKCIKDDDKQAYHFHAAVICIRLNYVTNYKPYPFKYCSTFTDCLYQIQTFGRGDLMNFLIADDFISQRFLKELKNEKRTINSMGKMIVLNDGLFFQLLGIKQVSGNGKTILRFLNEWCRVLTKASLSNIQSAQFDRFEHLKNTLFWERLKQMTSYLIRNRCSARFPPRTDNVSVFACDC